ELCERPLQLEREPGDLLRELAAEHLVARRIERVTRAAQDVGHAAQTVQAQQLELDPRLRDRLTLARGEVPWLLAARDVLRVAQHATQRGAQLARHLEHPQVALGGERAVDDLPAFARRAD